MSKTINQFRGKAGTIYIQKADPDEIDEGGREVEIWFESFCILGLGGTVLEALNDAWSHTGDIMMLISEARLKVVNDTQAVAGGGG